VGERNGPSVSSPPDRAPAASGSAETMLPYSSSQSRTSVSASTAAAAERKEPCSRRPEHGEKGLGTREREGARREKRFERGLWHMNPYPRDPPRRPRPPPRLRTTATAAVLMGVSADRGLRFCFFVILVDSGRGTNQACRWLFFVLMRVMLDMTGYDRALCTPDQLPSRLVRTAHLSSKE